MEGQAQETTEPTARHIGQRQGDFDTKQSDFPYVEVDGAPNCISIDFMNNEDDTDIRFREVKRD